ncbi:MAG: type III pantothenate kinase [Spirochaetota bacterium]
MAIDIGNTNIKVGVIDLNSNKDKFNLVTGFRLTTTQNLTSDELGIRIKAILRDNINRVNPYKMNAILCSSVVPKLNHTIYNMSRRYLGHTPYFINTDYNLGMKISYSNPSEIGADRIVNAVAVNEIYQAPSIIIDFGTATTFCALSKGKGYLGGVIVPGLLISLDALSEKAAKLPQVELVHPSQVIGDSTREAMVSGAFYSTVGTIEKVCKLMKEEILEKDKSLKDMNPSEIKVVATGGIANFIAQKTELIDIVDPLLTLRGILEIYNKNLDRFSIGEKV